MIISLPGAKVLGEEEVESEEGLPRDTGDMVLEAMLDDPPEANQKMKAHHLKDGLNMC